jgi:hypothetical protein
MTVMTSSSTTRPLRSVCIAAAVLACLPAFAGPKNVPFKASATTQETMGFDLTQTRCPSPPYLVGTTTGTGHASHLGAITLLATDCITPTFPTFNFSSGRLTFTAANGDLLKIAYQGVLLPTPGGVPSSYTISGSYNVTGGTGRFSDASGSGVLSGSEDLATREGRFQLDGTLSY